MARFNPSAPLIGGTCARVIVVTETQSVQCQTKFDFICTSNPANPSLADLQALRVAFMLSIQTAYLACLSPLTTLIAEITSELFYATSPTDDHPEPAPPAGTAGATNLPLEMAAVLPFSTTLRGQHGRGRVSMPAIPNTFQTPATNPNLINGAGITAYQALNALLLTPVTAGTRTWELAVLTRPRPCCYRCE